MAKSDHHLRLPVLRGDQPQMARQVRRLRRMELHVRGVRQARWCRAPCPRRRARSGKALAFSELVGLVGRRRRACMSGIGEFDRVCGGGLVHGLRAAGGRRSGCRQVDAASASRGTGLAKARPHRRLRHRRRGRGAGAGPRAASRRRRRAPSMLAAETDLRKILDGLKRVLKPDVVIVDSIQTMWADGVESARRAPSPRSAPAPTSWCATPRSSGAAVLLVGHVTKDGQIAGPRVVEHLVDAVVYFEGERGLPFRILRAVKNRLRPHRRDRRLRDEGTRPRGDAEPIGAVSGRQRRPRQRGLRSSPASRGRGPSLSRSRRSPRPRPTARPRRAIVGWDSARLAMILAVLETRCGLGFGGRDVYLSVAGGLRITEPAADLAVAAALISALADEPLPQDCVSFGEVALSGDIRPAGRTEVRLKEAAKLGFKSAFAPMGAESGSGQRSRHRPNRRSRGKSADARMSGGA